MVTYANEFKTRENKKTNWNKRLTATYILSYLKKKEVFCTQYVLLCREGEHQMPTAWSVSQVTSKEAFTLGVQVQYLLEVNWELKQRQRWRQREQQKSNWFILAKQQLRTCITLFLYISLPWLHVYNVKMLNFTSCRGREHKTTFFFFSWTLIQSFRIQLQKNWPKLTN